MDAAKNDRATLDSAEVDVAEGDAAEGDVAEGDAAVSSVLDLTSTRVQPPRECNSLLYINDEDRQLFLYNTEMDCIKDGDRLSDNGIKFFTQLLWVSFQRYVHVDTAMLALAPNAIAWFPSLDPAANHVQILHDSERMHWLLTARVNGVVYVLETLWVKTVSDALRSWRIKSAASTCALNTLSSRVSSKTTRSSVVTWTLPCCTTSTSALPLRRWVS